MLVNSVPAPALMFDIEKKPLQIIVHGKGKINIDTIALLHGTFRGLFAPEIKTIIFDLSGISHIDTSGLGALLAVYISAHKAGCELQMSNLTQRTEELLRVTKLSSFFKGC